MSNRPTCALRPSAKLTADSAVKLELSPHHRAVASADSVTQRRLATSSASSLPDLTPPDFANSPAPSLTPPDMAQTRTSSKRPQASHDASNVLSFDGDVGMKRARTNGTPSDLDASGMLHRDVQAMDIDSVDLCEESLNKIDPTADIKAFFKAVPRMPGQPKPRMSCTLCT